jgi:hypothetical protein
MVTRILPDEVVLTRSLVVLARREIGLRDDGGVESVVAAVPLTRDKDTHSLNLNFLVPIAQIARQVRRNSANPLDEDELVIFQPGAIITPILRVGFSYLLQMTLDESARGRNILKVYVQTAVRKSSLRQLEDTSVSFGGLVAITMDVPCHCRFAEFGIDTLD